ncbi:MAG: ABC transporter permease [Chloroflexi bacterium]|nr:ABC transporter permease [Chloroflexota bacterium]MDA1239791.1 ABC transporter permease [Chloroflexota bacterium]MQC47656.1 ABC transporter permease [Chloroflexota bacterium]
MSAYIVRRLAWLPVILFVVSFSTFTIARFGPGDPVSVAAGQIRDPEVLERIRVERGLDRPIPVQYIKWLTNAVQGDLGESYLQQGFSVSELIFPRMWISAQLGFVALVIVFAIGIPLGLIAARFSGTWIDPMIIGTLLFLQAIPVLVLIPPLIWLFALQLNWLPVGGWDGIFDVWWIGGVIAVPIPDPHLYIPLIAFTLPGFVGVARLVRVSALEVNLSDYVRTARAKGLSEAAVQFRHILPNSLLPLITVVGFALASIIEGALFVETLLGINGIGRFLFEAVTSRDYDVILAATVIFSTVFVVTNLLAELCYGLVDPRVRIGSTRR